MTISREIALYVRKTRIVVLQLNEYQCQRLHRSTAAAAEEGHRTTRVSFYDRDISRYSHLIAPGFDWTERRLSSVPCGTGHPGLWAFTTVPTENWRTIRGSSGLSTHQLPTLRRPSETGFTRARARRFLSCVSVSPRKVQRALQILSLAWNEKKIHRSWLLLGPEGFEFRDAVGPSQKKAKLLLFQVLGLSDLRLNLSFGPVSNSMPQAIEWMNSYNTTSPVSFSPPNIITFCFNSRLPTNFSSVGFIAINDSTTQLQDITELVLFYVHAIVNPGDPYSELFARTVFRTANGPGASQRLLREFRAYNVMQALQGATIPTVVGLYTNNNNGMTFKDLNLTPMNSSALRRDWNRI
ncbi:hypothetical protein GGX14DRAFT_611465 [Mycena pura]|uniref:Uncharacterized protein n=1 Tax=Mycena pura TaxID=153505 RepID=A0AAD6YSD8_9AGAR|nr:hypothetical protein GGX14DRAFT_611465 [Mycena pura]